MQHVLISNNQRTARIVGAPVMPCSAALDTLKFRAACFVSVVCVRHMYCLQSTNPLARCVEYLQEDLETMNTELKFWSAERQHYQVSTSFAKLWFWLYAMCLCPTCMTPTISTRFAV